MHRKIHSKDLLDATRQMIHLFLHKQIDEFMTHISDDFIWIGDYDELYMQGAENFFKNVHTESQMPPVKIVSEEYQMVAHDRALWITCGRCIANTELPDCLSISTKFHFTFTWRREEDQLRLVHAMACHVPDADQDRKVKNAQVFGENAERRNALKKQEQNSKKLMLCDTTGCVHYIYPSEILYIQANACYSTVYTKNSSFTCHRSLGSFPMDGLYPIHRSYLVNKLYVVKIRRFVLTLTDCTELPISRNRYTEFKELLGE